MGTKTKKIETPLFIVVKSRIDDEATMMLHHREGKWSDFGYTFNTADPLPQTEYCIDTAVRTATANRFAYKHSWRRSDRKPKGRCFSLNPMVV